MKNIVIFASGSGTNAENIVKYFKSSTQAKVVSIFTNNPQAKVIQRAQNLEVPVHIFSKKELIEGEILPILEQYQPTLIVLAGFLLKVPENLINKYPNAIVNIHPALLPNYGGKGMYGMHVHEAVVANKETQTGITIHYVNENYDEGATIFQAKVGLTQEDTAATVAAKIHELEQLHFPEVLSKILNE